MSGNSATESRIQRRDGEALKKFIARVEAAELPRKRALYDAWSAERKERQESASTAGSRKSSLESATGSVIIPVSDSAPPSDQSSQDSQGVTADELLRKFGASRGASKVSKQTKAPKSTSKKTTSANIMDVTGSDNDSLGFGNESSSSSKAKDPNAARLKSKKGLHKSSEPGSKNREDSKMRRPSGSESDSKTTTRKKEGGTKMAGLTNNKTSNSTASTNAHGKRPSVSNNAISFDELPKAQKKTSVASPQSPERDEPEEEGGIVAGRQDGPPDWYNKEPMPTSRGRNEAGVSTLLQRLADAIRKGSIDIARDILHKLPFEQVTRPLLKANRILHDRYGLPQLFRAGAENRWPYDIRADATEIYLKYCREIFETDLLRGIQLKSGKKGEERSNDRIQPGYPGRVDFHAWGDNDLSNGTWFPTQLTTIRDGAHGHTQGGISGKAGDGAWSVILTGHSGYPDEDHGDVVLYCGTDSDDGTVTDNTQLLLDNIHSNRPVRLIRKYTLKSAWAPEVGYRYDGLYAVQSFEKLGEPRLARHRFRLVRLPGQDPIRGGTGPEKRPTEQEIERYRMDKRFR